MMTLLTEHAKEKFGLPAEWEMMRWRRMPQTTDNILYHEITGSVAPLLKAGKSKGRRNWRRRDRTTERLICITPKEHAEWLAGWEKRTGKCAECIGEGRVFKSWHHITGTEYRECPKCKGAGTSHSVEATR